MTASALVRRNLVYFWRTNLAVVAGVAIAVGVLAGALLVGDSVRGSLRSLFLSRLGNTGVVVVANQFFRESLASDVAGDGAPLIAFTGVLTHEPTGSRRNDVDVYGVDERFWRFHGYPVPDLGGRGAAVSAALARELSIEADDVLLLRVEQPTEVARGSLHGAKDDAGRTLRLTTTSIDPPEFALFPQQDEIRAVFVPLARLQRDLGEPERVNTILTTESASADAVTERLRSVATLSDLGVELRPFDEGGGWVVESSALMLGDPLALAAYSAASELGAETTTVFTYLANAMRVGDRETPYSLVTALDEEAYVELLSGAQPMAPSITLNEWAAADLGASPGDTLSMDYFVWRSEGRIETETAEFVVDGIVPIEGLAAERDLAPDYPGISETEDLSDWDPPFPLDLRRVRDKDEEYWDTYGTTPKAFIRLARGQRIWPVRQGSMTSIRVRGEPAREALELAVRSRLDPLTLGYTVIPAREEGLVASRGATDFGEYFVYFSYFLMVAALLLTGLFFKLGVEQRLKEVGTLRAFGFPMRTVQRIFVSEGVALSLVGAFAGTVVALGYAGFVMYGLRTFWFDAVGTRLLSLHVSSRSLLLGGVAGVGIASLSIAWTLRHLRAISPRSLLAGVREEPDTGRGAEARSRRRSLSWGLAMLVLAGILLLASSVGGLGVSEVLGFFGAGNLLLASLLCFQWAWLNQSHGAFVSGTGTPAVARLGLRNASHRPGRSLVAIALIAFATFTIVAVDAFRKDSAGVASGRDSGGGGYALVGETVLPFQWDPNTVEGRDALNLPFAEDPEFIDGSFRSFRLREGDDASCLNLYRPQNPRILGVGADFADEGRFVFAASLAEGPEERANPWLLLDRVFDDGAVPVIGDANSMAYVLHLGLGEDFLLPRVGETALRLRLVATLSDSVFQGELLMAESQFLRQFPEVDGFRYVLAETAQPSELGSLLEQRMSDYGIDMESVSARLAGFHRVENTYLSTFQTLGGLGLVLGTFGLATILLRNVLERRRELALLRAVGFHRRDFSTMILAENALLLGFGLVTGAAAALVAIFPALIARGGSFGGGTLPALLLAVLASGALSSMLALSAVHRTPLLDNLRSE